MESGLDEKIMYLIQDLNEKVELLFNDCGIHSVNSNDTHFIENYFGSSTNPIQPSVKNNQKIKEIQAIYETALEKLLKRELKTHNGPDVLVFLNNTHFHKALYACCLETILYVYNITNFTFEKVLEITEINSFEFWKQINSFGKFDPTMPNQLKWHFREIEVKILSVLA